MTASYLHELQIYAHLPQMQPGVRFGRLPFALGAESAINPRVKGWDLRKVPAMGANSQKAFTADKLRKFEVSGANGGFGDRNKAATADDYGRKAARTSDSSAFAAGGAAKAPSLGRAGRANGGRTRDISKVSDSGPKGYGDRPLLRAKGGRIGKQLGGSVERAMASTPGGLTGQPSDIVRRPNLRDRVEGGSRYLEREIGPNVFSDPGDYRGPRAKGGRIGKQLGGALPPGAATPPGALAPPPAGQLPGLPGLGRAKGGKVSRAKGGRIGRANGGSFPSEYSERQGPSSEDQKTQGDYDRPGEMRANGGRTSLARGGKAKGKGKTVVNVIVGGHGDQQQPPAMPPHPMMPPPPPPPPPQAASGPRPPMPMGMPMMPPGGPPGPPGPPGGGGMPPGMPPPGLGRASGGRISEKYGSNSGLGRMEITKRQGHGKMMLPE